MRWSFGSGQMCLTLSPSAADTMQDILQFAADAMREGFLTMNPSELVDFNIICEQMEMTSIPPLTPAQLPALRRVP